MCAQNEVYLDGFEGEGEGIQQCVELLYGDEILFDKIHNNCTLAQKYNNNIYNIYKIGK